jgi:hypothetical protein
VVIGRGEEQQLHRLGLHSRVVAVATSHKQATHQLWMKKNLAARYKAVGGQQSRERATGSCISPHKQNIEHVMGEVEERSGLAVPEQRQDLQPMRRSSNRL